VPAKGALAQSGESSGRTEAHTQASREGQRSAFDEGIYEGLRTHTPILQSSW